jgi:hypothetical protein
MELTRNITTEYKISLMGLELNIKGETKELGELIQGILYSYLVIIGG